MRIDVGCVHEDPRRTPVAAEVDVLVCGGGPAGVGAALAAAAAGARTLVVERHGMLGGVWTAGLLNPFFESDGHGWLVESLVRDLRAQGAWHPWKSWAPSFDTEAMKLLLERRFAEAGIEWWYHTQIADAIVVAGEVRGVIVEGKAGRQAVLARTVIDCTGDGDVAARAGARWRMGRPADGLAQPMTLMFRIAGVPRFDQASSEQLFDLLERAVVDHHLDVQLPFTRGDKTPWIIHTPDAGVHDVQATHVYRVDPLDPRALTRATVEARRQAHDLVRALRHVPGFEGARLLQTAGAIGVREARRIVGRYHLDAPDLSAGRRFADGIASCRFALDIHELVPGMHDGERARVRTRPYEIPFRCLVPDGLSRLLVAGRCISGSHVAHASYRVTGTCMAMGQAAGLAAAMAAADGGDAASLDGAAVRAELRRRGARFLDD